MRSRCAANTWRSSESSIRQGPVLFHNLQAYLGGEPLKKFKPQKIYLYILNLGDGTGLAIYGPLV